MDINAIKNEFCQRLLQTGRPGTETIITNLERLGFFAAPASTRFHLAYAGGLAEHSLNVCDMAIDLRNQMIARNPAIEPRLPIESVIFVSLMHDICKAEIYKQGTRNVKNDAGVWEKVPVYEPDYSHFPVGHGEKSVIRLLSWGIKLNEDEILAIRWHMSAWDLPFQSHELMGNLNSARDKSPLLTLVQCADMLASGIVENK